MGSKGQGKGGRSQSQGTMNQTKNLKPRASHQDRVTSWCDKTNGRKITQIELTADSVVHEMKPLSRNDKVLHEASVQPSPHTGRNG